MRLNVVGVNISFFLPRRVVSCTSGEEFHSLNATANPLERSHRLKSEICVLLPEPSIPSTTISLPRWRFGVKSESMRGSRTAAIIAMIDAALRFGRHRQQLGSHGSGRSHARTAVAHSGLGK